jgi:DnaK suppressor protein
MKKRKAVASKKPAAARKKAGPLKKLAAKAMKLVKSSRPKAKAAKPAKAVKHAPPKAAAKKPAPKPVAARSVGGIKTHARAERGPYRPSAAVSLLTESDIRRMPESAYMNDVQLDFFRQRLLQMRSEVVEREVDVKERLHQRESFADPADRATAEEEHWLDLRLRERESLLLRKIDDALRRIRDRETANMAIARSPASRSASRDCWRGRRRPCASTSRARTSRSNPSSGIAEPR